MRLLAIAKVEQPNGLTLVFGVVEGEAIRVGDAAVLVDRDGNEERVTLSAIMPDHEGQKSFDEAAPGTPVKVMLRRRPAVLDATKLVALDKP